MNESCGWTGRGIVGVGDGEGVVEEGGLGSGVVLWVEGREA